MLPKNGILNAVVAVIVLIIAIPPVNLASMPVRNACCEIQPAWLRSKEPNASKLSLTGPTKNHLHTCKEASGKTCRHNLTGYISLCMQQIQF